METSTRGVLTRAQSSAPSIWARAGDSIPLFNASGNHGFNSVGLTNWPQDRARATSAGRYQMDTYCCTNGTTSASYPSAWYAFDAGTARFYVLEAAWSEGNVGTANAYKNDYDNHWTQSSPEYQWLKHDLETHPGGVKFAVWHYPMYSDNATEDSSSYLQGPASLEGLLAANNVSIGFNGHAHMYQRNLKPAGGIVTYLTGGGGAKLQPIGGHGCTPLDAYGIGWSYTANRGSQCGAAPVPTSVAQVFHFLKVTVNGSTVTVAPTNSLGQTFDVQTYNFSSTPDTTPPTAPGNLVATARDTTTVDLSWTAATDNIGVAGYDVYRNGTLIAPLGATTVYTDTAAAPATSYTYTVRARDAAGNTSPPSNAAAVTTPAPPPALTFAPTDDTYIQASSPTATAGSATTVQVDNSPVKHMLLRFNVTGIGSRRGARSEAAALCDRPFAEGRRLLCYDRIQLDRIDSHVEQRPGHDGAGRRIPWGGGRQHLVRRRPDVPGAGRWSRQPARLLDFLRWRELRVAQQLDGICSSARRFVRGHGHAAAGRAEQPGGLGQRWRCSGRIELDGTRRPGRQLHRQTVDNEWRPICPIESGVATTSATDASAASGQTYYYVVAAVGSGGESVPSNEVSVTLRPSAPTGVTATAGDGQVALSWNAASGATSYAVDRAEVAGGPYTTVASPTATGYTDPV